MKTKIGNPGYFPPEIENSASYDNYGNILSTNASYEGQQADIFTLGVILYNMVSNNCIPFKDTKPGSDYKYFSKHRSKLLLNQTLPDKSESLKKLLTALFQCDPNQRPSIADIL